jgi:hypothetical protein
MQNKDKELVKTVEEMALEYNLELEDLEPLGEVVFFGGSKMHKLDECTKP